MDERLKRLLEKNYGTKVLAEQNNQNKLLHAIFTMSSLQARITLCMVMYGADFEYAVAVTLRLSPEN